ncbi:MAG: thioredoxin family protein [Microcystaceae cyanobacterium]
MSFQEITDSQFEQELTSDQPVLAYFWAQWCGPCRLMSPAIASLDQDYPNHFKILKLSVDSSPETVQQYKIEGVPAIRLFQQGQLVLSHEGAIPKLKLLELLKDYLPETAS